MHIERGQECELKGAFYKMNDSFVFKVVFPSLLRVSHSISVHLCSLYIFFNNILSAEEKYPF